MSSYENEVTFCDIIGAIAHSTAPRRIVEIGILAGHSLEAFTRGCPGAQIQAYDIFQEFNGNHADKKHLENKFIDFANVSINFGDFYKLHESFENDSIDILHVDIANDGDVYEYAVDKYLRTVRPGGLLIMEGGTVARDLVPWMAKYNKRPIRDFLGKATGLNFKVWGQFPGITIFKK